MNVAEEKQSCPQGVQSMKRDRQLEDIHSVACVSLAMEVWCSLSPELQVPSSASESLVCGVMPDSSQRPERVGAHPVMGTALFNWRSKAWACGQTAPFMRKH